MWSNERLKSFLKQNFVFWQPTNSSDEGRYYIQFYPVQTYPHIGIIDPITRSRFSELVFEGPMEADKLMGRLQEFLKNFHLSDGMEIEKRENAEEAKEPVFKKRVKITEMSEQEMLEKAISESLMMSATNEEDEENCQMMSENEDVDKEKDEEEEMEMGMEQVEQMDKGKGKKRKFDIEEPEHVMLDPDVQIRVRSSNGKLETLKLHSSDTIR